MRALSKVAVVIPIYKEELDDLEKISLAQVRKVLKNYPIIFVAPEGKKFSYLEPGEMLIQFHPQYFQSVETYSQLLLQPFFYEPFKIFEYMLIYQLDAFVFYDALEDFCRLDYDYIGAAWPVSWGVIRVGNGGLSLRKVKTHYKLLTEAASWRNWENMLLSDSGEYFFVKYGVVSNSEDSFFAFCGANKAIDFQTAPVEVANLFAMEHYPARHVKKLGGDLPFGCHGWTKLSADFYIKLFAQFGYDLRSLRNLIGGNETSLSACLTKLAMTRLIRDLDWKKSLAQFLPTKKFSSVRVIRSPEAIKILARLLVEENSLADKIFFYDEKNSRDLLNDVTKENLPHLLISMDYDVCGEQVVSFRQEYLKAQEKFFHNLGR